MLPVLLLPLFGQLLLSASCVIAAAEKAAEHFDVLVYSANAAGVGAAVSAARNNRYRVKVVEPLTMIGGMAAAGGVSLMNQGGCGLSGLSKNWSQIVGRYYGLKDGMPYPPFPRMVESELGFWELLHTWSSIDVSVGCHVTQVNKGEDGFLGPVEFLCNDTQTMMIHASYIIDASYDGDIMTMAGVDHVSGREPRTKYNESLAGVQWTEWSDLESFALQNISINPYDEETGQLLKYIDPGPMPEAGSGDDKLMAFQYFVCLSTTPGNQVPFYPPENYNPKDFEMLLRQTRAVMENGLYPEGPPLDYFGDIQCYDKVVEATTGNRDCLYCCGTGPVDSDTPTLNKGWATSDYQERLKIANEYKYYIQGSLYFMAHDPRMPEATRHDAQKHGYCKDEYANHGNFPPQLYVRISNRLVGQSLLTQNNIVNPSVKPDGVAMGCWTFDQHTMSRHAVPDPSDPTGKRMILRNEGFFRAQLGKKGLSCDHPDAKCDDMLANTYNVPFGVMVPADPKQASNLLVPVAISASSVAYSSTRIENMFMDLGSAAGVAVVQLLAANEAGKRMLAVQETNVKAVQDILATVYKQNLFGPTQQRFGEFKVESCSS